MLDPIYYPANHLKFARVFFKLEAIDRKANKTEPSTSIYLPLPNEIFSQNFTMSYTEQNLGAFGETAAQNYDTVRNVLSSVINNEVDYGAITGADIADAAKSVASDVVSLAKTQLEESLLSGFGSGDNVFAIGMQGIGYTYAPNKTQIFQGVTQNRTFVLSWDLFARNINDAINIEKIFNEIEAASLPKLEKDVLRRTINETISEFSTIFSGANDALKSIAKKTLEDMNIPSSVINLLASPAEGDKTQAATEENVGMWDKLAAYGLPVTDVIGEIFSAEELYPTTYEVPNSMKLSIIERVGDDDVREINDLVHFPYMFFIQQFVSNVIGGSGDSGATFIKHVKDNGETEYFPSGRKLVIYLAEERPLTATDYNNRL